MTCIIEFSNPFLRFNFCTNKHKQKIWLDALLRYGTMDLRELAFTLGIDKTILRDVYYGKHFLERDEADKIAKLVLILLGD